MNAGARLTAMLRRALCRAGLHRWRARRAHFGLHPRSCAACGVWDYRRDAAVAARQVQPRPGQLVPETGER